eukprot:508089-Pyramimonas_sp.AAC.1
MARFDLLRAVCHAASCITKWTEQQDIDLFRLLCHKKSTTAYNKTSWVGSDMEDVTIRQYSDADLASDLRTHRSTSASRQVIWAPCARANQSMACRRQTCVSRGTLEAEIVAADLALRTQLLPALPLLASLLQREGQCTFVEDNHAVCEVIMAGGSMKLMHLPRSHRVDVAAISEQSTR